MSACECLQDEPYFGLSPIIGNAKPFIDAAAAAHCTVLLRGETGTGKGRLARWIHEHSSRRGNSFVDINCSGLKGDLLKSELFGHSKGAFTGALNDREGLIEEANGGTLFLDEIGDMDVGVQCELLKAIEEKNYRRVGENKLRSSDFRLICATNRNLPEAMGCGDFRPDLFYRINTLSICLPSLRERTEDIDGLTRYMLTSMGYRHFPVRADVVDALTSYHWPGNIRELRNVIERALVFAQGSPLTLKHFPGLENPAKSGGTPLTPQGEVVWNLEHIEKEHILRALKHFKGDKEKASAALGISRASMYRKLEKIWNQDRKNGLIA